MATGTAGTTARKSASQLIHYLRFAVNYNDTGISSGVGKQYLPAGAIIVGTDVYISAAFNAGTTNVLTVGTNTTTDNNIIASGDVDETATGLTQNVKPTGTALGPLSADAQVFAKFAQTGTAASAGKAYVVIKYIPDNDL
jgi:hypothetical protein